MMHITAHHRSNNVGVRNRASYMFETTAVGSVLPSYDMETRVTDKDLNRNTKVVDQLRCRCHYCYAHILYYC